MLATCILPRSTHACKGVLVSLFLSGLSVSFLTCTKWNLILQWIWQLKQTKHKVVAMEPIHLQRHKHVKSQHSNFCTIVYTLLYTCSFFKDFSQDNLSMWFLSSSTYFIVVGLIGQSSLALDSRHSLSTPMALLRPRPPWCMRRIRWGLDEDRSETTAFCHLNMAIIYGNIQGIYHQRSVPQYKHTSTRYLFHPSQNWAVGQRWFWSSRIEPLTESSAQCEGIMRCWTPSSVVWRW